MESIELSERISEINREIREITDRSFNRSKKYIETIRHINMICDVVVNNSINEGRVELAKEINRTIEQQLGG